MDEEIQDTDNEQQPENHIVAKQVSVTRISPLPPPSDLEGYEKTLPGSADRILKMAEDQMKHRQDIEKREIELDARDSLLGSVFAFIVSMTAMVGSFVLIYTGHEVAGSFLGSLGLGSIITAFKHGRKSDDK